MGYIATRGANKQRPLLISIAAPSDLYCDLYSDLYSDLYRDLYSDLYRDPYSSHSPADCTGKRCSMRRCARTHFAECTADAAEPAVYCWLYSYLYCQPCPKNARSRE